MFQLLRIFELRWVFWRSFPSNGTCAMTMIQRCHKNLYLQLTSMCLSIQCFRTNTFKLTLCRQAEFSFGFFRSHVYQILLFNFFMIFVMFMIRGWITTIQYQNYIEHANAMHSAHLKFWVTFTNINTFEHIWKSKPKCYWCLSKFIEPY